MHIQAKTSTHHRFRDAAVLTDKGCASLAAYRVAQNKPPPQILLTNFVTDALSIAYSDVLFDADSESPLIFYPRAKFEPLRDLSPQEILWY